MYVQGVHSVCTSRVHFVFGERASKIIALTPCLPGERVKSFIQRLPAVCSGYALCIFRALEDDRFVEQAWAWRQEIMLNNRESKPVSVEFRDRYTKE